MIHPANTTTITFMDKKPRQVKQRYYYIFWTFATIAVVIGQIHVAYSYNNLADALRESLL